MTPDLTAGMTTTDKLAQALRYYRDECSGAEPSLSVFEHLLDQALAEYDSAPSAPPAVAAKPVPDAWLVNVHRLVQGFEHVSGLARLWEPDYSTGRERALWASATEACADVAKLLEEARKD